MSEPIAIVGLGGVLPGATKLDDFWRVVERGVDTASEPPPRPMEAGPRSGVHGGPGSP